jgi:hypothetical protein
MPIYQPDGPSKIGHKRHSQRHEKASLWEPLRKVNVSVYFKLSKYFISRY